MILFKIAGEITAFLRKAKINGQTVGFVPTMGALHQGHLSLIEQSGKENNLTVCSIFVNPTQFNNPEDFTKYPITIEEDIDKLEKAGCDLLFLPDPEEIYPPGHKKFIYDLGFLETLLEGKYRPGHFQGVCQVVDCLLAIVVPDSLYLGQKDYQQCMVIARLVTLKNIPIRIINCPTLRERDGLAMSSRNLRLNKEQRMVAPVIYQVMLWVQQQIKKGPLADLKSAGRLTLMNAGFKVDYLEIADAGTLESIENWNGKDTPVVLIAAWLNDIRLIDNLVLQ